VVDRQIKLIEGEQRVKKIIEIICSAKKAAQLSENLKLDSRAYLQMNMSQFDDIVDGIESSKEAAKRMAELLQKLIVDK